MVEFMLVLPIFIGLFILAFELALLMTRGELLTLSTFRAARISEVRSAPLVSDSGWQRRQQGNFTSSSNYTPVTSSGVQGFLMQRNQGVVPQSRYRRHLLEDNCLPGWGIPCAR